MNRLLLVSVLLMLVSACSTTHQNDGGKAAKAASEMPQLTIYHLEGRRSERVVWLMEELGLPYKLEYVRGDLMASMAKVKALGHEMPQVPTVVIGDQILVESGAIIETILDRYAPGELSPAVDSLDYPGYMMWMHYAEGSLAARLLSDYRAWRTRPPTQRSRFVDSEAVVQFAENFLAKNPWFGGQEFSAADIMMLFPLNLATMLNLVDAEQFPNIANWKERVRAREAYQKMLSVARPDGMIGLLPPIKQRPPSERKPLSPEVERILKPKD